MQYIRLNMTKCIISTYNLTNKNYWKSVKKGLSSQFNHKIKYFMIYEH